MHCVFAIADVKRAPWPYHEGTISLMRVSYAAPPIHVGHNFSVKHMRFSVLIESEFPQEQFRVNEKRRAMMLKTAKLKNAHAKSAGCVLAKWT